MNILILSVGTRNKIVQYFRKELKGIGKVYTTDCSNLAPALYDSDGHFIVPRIDEPEYLDVILTLCQEHNIKAVFSLIDPELSLLAENAHRFLDIGTTPIISNAELVERCFNKYAFYHYATIHGVNTVKTYQDIELFYADQQAGLIDYPIFVKPINGSASININKVSNQAELDLLFTQHYDLIIQEFMEGQEIGVDVYADMLSGEVVSIFSKNKLLMRSGETDKSQAFKDNKLFNLIASFTEQAGFKGMLDFDVFKVDGEYYISEVNPRFGGGYLHAYEAGVNFPQMIIQNLQGNTNAHTIGNYKENTYMMKYNEVKFLEELH